MVLYFVSKNLEVVTKEIFTGKGSRGWYPKMLAFFGLLAASGTLKVVQFDIVISTNLF